MKIWMKLIQLKISYSELTQQAIFQFITHGVPLCFDLNKFLQPHNSSIFPKLQMVQGARMVDNATVLAEMVCTKRTSHASKCVDALMVCSKCIDFYCDTSKICSHWRSEGRSVGWSVMQLKDELQQRAPNNDACFFFLGRL